VPKLLKCRVKLSSPPRFRAPATVSVGLGAVHLIEVLFAGTCFASFCQCLAGTTRSCPRNGLASLCPGARWRRALGKWTFAPGFLHSPKKPFVAKAGGCDVSTVQVLVLIYRLYFCLGPHALSIILTTLKFATGRSSALPVSDPVCSRWSTHGSPGNPGQDRQSRYRARQIFMHFRLAV